VVRPTSIVFCAVRSRLTCQFKSMALNAKTAKALGLAVPPSIRLRPTKLSSEGFLLGDVAYWHKADVAERSTDVCFRGKADIG
jgi:hypothetical protein